MSREHRTASLFIFYLVSLTAVVSGLLEDAFPLPPSQCEISMRVDPDSASNWRQDYDEYINGSVSVNSTLKLACDNLQEALVAMHTTIVHRSNNCIELIVPKGTHQITEAVELSRNIHIRGEQPGEVFVNFSVTVSEKVSFFNVLTLMNADHVEISGIEFFNSPGNIVIENVSLVRVSDSSFRWFSRGALDVYQCFTVTVFNCTFEFNGFTGTKKIGYQYRGHAGGLSVGFDDNYYSVNGTDPNSVPDIKGVHISDCTFRNNTSDPKNSGNLISTSQLLQAFIFPGRGGAIAITINTSFPFNASIDNCVIMDNTATSFGGGVYLGYSGFAAHTTNINNTLFINNFCDGPSGGLQLGFIEGGANGNTVRLEVLNSEFLNNTAQFGGAIHLFSNSSGSDLGVVQLSNVALIQNCTFVGNSAIEYGAAICLASLLFLTDSSNIEPLSIVDCSFIGNNGRRAGVLSTAYLPLAFYGYNLFYQNTGRVLVISGTYAEVSGVIDFQSNGGGDVDAGALYVLSFGQLRLKKGANIVFQNNTGVLGASLVVVSVATISDSYSQLLYNPLCVLSSEESTQRPQDWTDVGIHFSGNRALVGSAVFLNDVHLCSWAGFGPVFFNVDDVFEWNFVNFTEDNVNEAHYPQDTDPFFYVQTPSKQIFLTGSDNVTAYPGELFALNVTGKDQLGKSTIVPVSISDSNGRYEFSPSAAVPDIIQRSSISTRFTTVKHINEEGEVQKVGKNGSGSISVNALFDRTSLSLTFALTPEDCPAGYMLVHSSETDHLCYCNAVNNSQIIECEDERIILAEGRWGFQSMLTGALDSLVTYPCPHQYCQCFELSNSTCAFIFDPSLPDAQCHCTRKGHLCGNCRNESGGFTAILDRCESCDKAYGLLIVILIIADSVTIAFLLMIKSSPPGWMYPALFYLQAVPYLTLHFPVPFEIAHHYVFYVSSALSFYFAYDFCLGPDITAITMYFIKFIPFIVSVGIMIPVVIYRWRYRLISKPWPGLWWVVLFQYTHVVYTCMTILNCPILPGDDGLVSARWYVNGNVTCFTGTHLPLALFACVILLFCVLIIPIVVSYTQRYIERPSLVLNSIQPATSSFNDNFSWWSAVELSRRLIVAIMVVASPGNDYPVIFSLMITIGVFLFIQPFKSMMANLLEAFLATDVLILLMIRIVLNSYSSLPSSTLGSTNYSFGNECSNSSTVQDNSYQYWYIFPLYSIPLIVFVLAICISAVWRIKLYIQRRRSSKSISNDQTIENYNREDVDVVQPPTTFVEISYPSDVPLSAMWSLFVGKSHNASRKANDSSVNQNTRGKKWKSLGRQGQYNVNRDSLHQTGVGKITRPQSMLAAISVDTGRDDISESYVKMELGEITDYNTAAQAMSDRQGNAVINESYEHIQLSELSQDNAIPDKNENASQNVSSESCDHLQLNEGLQNCTLHSQNIHNT